MNATAHIVAPEEIMAFIDGEISVAEAQAVSAHLEDCAECAALADELRATSRSLVRWEVEAMPPRLEASIKELAGKSGNGFASARPRAFRGSRWSPWHWRFWAIGTGSVAAAVLILAVSLSTSHRNDRQPFVEDSIQRASESLESVDGALADKMATDLRPRTEGKDSKERRATSMAQVSTSPSAAPMAGVAGMMGDRFSGGVLAPPPPPQSPPGGPMIARSVSLVIRVKDVDHSRSALDGILARYRGYSAQLNLTRSENTARSLQASLRIPAPELPSALADLKTLGSVENESQSGEEVTQQHMDLVARLKTARETEERYRAILEQRTGKISDVLEVEQAIARVRGEIESMEAEQKALEQRVDFASVEIQLSEEYKAPLNSPDDSAGTRIHNAFVAGYRNAKETLLGFLLFFEEYGPSLAIWLAILALPVVLIWRRYKKVRSRF